MDLIGVYGSNKGEREARRGAIGRVSQEVSLIAYDNGVYYTNVQ